LVVTLPLAAALLSGTALGGWITTHQGAIAMGATIYFLGGLTVAAMLLLTRSGVSGAAEGGSSLASTRTVAGRGTGGDITPACCRARRVPSAGGDDGAGTRPSAAPSTNRQTPGTRTGVGPDVGSESIGLTPRRG